MGEADTIASELSARVDTLETELAFQTETVRSLNDALALQQQDMLHMQRQLTLLGEQLKGLRESTTAPAAGNDSERPPHY